MTYSIEGNPFITRFKTYPLVSDRINVITDSIEGNPFITRFKTNIDYIVAIKIIFKY